MTDINGTVTGLQGNPVSSQPPGQRVEDKIKWAKEILALYDKKD